MRPLDKPDAHDMDVICYLIGKVQMYGLQGIDADNTAHVFAQALEQAAYNLRDVGDGRCTSCGQVIVDLAPIIGAWQCGCGIWTDNPDVRQQACKATAEAVVAISHAGFYTADEADTPAS